MSIDQQSLFPAEAWEEVVNYIQGAMERPIIYFPAVMARDLLLNWEDILELQDRGIDLFTTSFPYKKQVGEVLRRLSLTELNKGDVFILKRDGDRLQIQGREMEKINAMYSQIQTATQFFPGKFDDELETIRKEHPQDLVTQNDPVNILNPKDLEKLGPGFPIAAWVKVRDWASYVRKRGQVDRILDFVTEELAPIYPVPTAEEVEFRKSATNSVYNRCFPMEKQMSELRRREKKPMILHRTARVLNKESKRMEQDPGISGYIADKYHGADSNLALSIELESVEFEKESKLGYGSPFQSDPILQLKMTKFAADPNAGATKDPIESEYFKYLDGSDSDSVGIVQTEVTDSVLGLPGDTIVGDNWDIRSVFSEAIRQQEEKEETKVPGQAAVLKMNQELEKNVGAPKILPRQLVPIQPRLQSGTTHVHSTNDKFEVTMDTRLLGLEDVTVHTVNNNVVIEGRAQVKHVGGSSSERRIRRFVVLPDWVKAENVVWDLSSDGLLSITAEKQVMQDVEEVISIPNQAEQAWTNAEGPGSFRRM